MTLLELLVKELPKRGGWPEDVWHVTQDSDGLVNGYGESEPYLNTKYWDSTGFIRYLFCDQRQPLPVDWGSSVINREQYEAAIAAQQPVWNGEGLPPVGSKVESFINGDWRLVKVVYVGETGGEYEALVFDVKTTKPAWADQFRPIRTEADRKRGEAIDALISLGVFTRPVAEKTVYAIAAGKIPGVELTK